MNKMVNKISIDTKFDIDVKNVNVKLNLINYFVGFISCQICL